MFPVTGTSNRTVAATQMNATSSRAHTVVTIVFSQISKNEAGQETKKTSVINLVDLAGEVVVYKWVIVNVQVGYTVFSINGKLMLRRTSMWVSRGVKL